MPASSPRAGPLWAPQMRRARGRPSHTRAPSGGPSLLLVLPVARGRLRKVKHNFGASRRIAHGRAIDLGARQRQPHRRPLGDEDEWSFRRKLRYPVSVSPITAAASATPMAAEGELSGTPTLVVSVLLDVRHLSAIGELDPEKK